MPIVVSYTLQPVTITNMTQLVVRPGNAAGEIVATAYFTVKSGSCGWLMDFGL